MNTVIYTLKTNDKDESINISQENDRLRSILEDIENEELCIYEKDKNAFTPETQRCVYELLENHVAAKNVGNVINCVLSLVNKHANRLPSTSTVHNMNLQRLVLAHKQISEVVVEKENLSFYSDETSKFGNKVCGYHVRDEDGHYFTLGLRDLVTKSASDTLETFTEILHDIDEAADNSTSASKKILTNISSTMSDSASTEIKFNALLEEYRLALLPYTIDNYNQLNEEEKHSVNKLMNFFL